jgi:hypothetical protein
MGCKYDSFRTAAFIITLLKLLNAGIPIGFGGLCDVFQLKYPLNMKQLVALDSPFFRLCYMHLYAK